MGGEYNSPCPDRFAAKIPLSFRAMQILALDTSTPTGSVALAAGGEVTECRIGDADRTHGERLPGDITALLAAHALTPADIDLYAVCSGPGSFTGLRVGLATIQALALVNRRRVVAVPTLEALACAALWAPAGGENTELVGAWMNAHRGEVFAALYDVSQAATAGAAGDGGAALTEVVGPVAAPPDVVLRHWRERLGGDGRRVAVIGDAVAPVRERLRRELNCAGLLTLLVPPLAPIAARIAAAATGRNAKPPHAVRPVYVRRPDAVLARERRQGLGGTCA